MMLIILIEWQRLEIRLDIIMISSFDNLEDSVIRISF